VLNLPDPGVMVTTSPAFNPAILRGIILHAEDPQTDEK